MNRLLPEIRTALQGMTRFSRASDCYITPHENWMPTGTRQPCIGIKDGGTVRRELTCGLVELTATVALVGFVRMTADGETAVCGDAGIFPLLDEAAALLLASWTAVEGCQGLEVGPDRPSELYQAENTQWIVKLVRSMVYTIQR